MVDPYLFPARGRKLASSRLTNCRSAGVLIPTFSPQGDGNCLTHSEQYHRSASEVDPYLFPARGRKLDEVSTQQDWLRLFLLIPTFSPQGDGNKRRRFNRKVAKSALIPTFSPQGDGNVCCPSEFRGENTATVDPYLFPARGRKRRHPNGHGVGFIGS